ncbi:MAG: competence/damage-inducible protein A [Lachnospiraceae bacterium]
MIVELISVGTEILLGNIVNTNASYLSEQLALLGISVYYQTTVGDNEGRLKEALKMALERSDMVIMTGGLGPTPDDLSKEVAADCLGLSLYRDETVVAELEAYFKRMGIANATENNWKQAMIPEGAWIMHNPNGTAPGMVLEKDGKRIALLPGPPNECIPMYQNSLKSYLKSLQPGALYTEMVKMVGITESVAATMADDLITGMTNPTVAPYAKTGEVHLRVTAMAESEEKGKMLVQPVVAELKKRFGTHIFTTSEEVTLEQALVEKLKEQNITVTFAESCTGGMIAGRLTNVPGASEVFHQGFVTYANEAKQRAIHVSPDTLERYGAVSGQTAKEMAQGALAQAGADIAISVTGIAGPGGGTDEKPVGLVYIGCATDERVYAQEYHFIGNRKKVREAAVQKALVVLREELQD